MYAHIEMCLKDLDMSVSFRSSWARVGTDWKPNKMGKEDKSKHLLPQASTHV